MMARHSLSLERSIFSLSLVPPVLVIGTLWGFSILLFLCQGGSYRVAAGIALEYRRRRERHLRSIESGLLLVTPLEFPMNRT